MHVKKPFFSCVWTGDLRGVSENKRLNNAKNGRRYKNMDYMAFQVGLSWTMMTERVESSCNPVRVEIGLKVPASRDIDNLIKPILDCLQKAMIIENDRRVVELLVRKETAKESSISVKVFRMKGG